MRLLLDTNAFLWFVLDEPNLGKRAREVIGDAANDVEVSPATLWEIAIKIRLGSTLYRNLSNRLSSGNCPSTISRFSQLSQSILLSLRRFPFTIEILSTAYWSRKPWSKTFRLSAATPHWRLIL